jgi:hypothetical protein
MTNLPRFPLYIPSKSRYESAYTAKYLDYMKVPYRLVVEEQEYYNYVATIGDRKKLLVLEDTYKDKYDYCDDLGRSIPTGSGPARNFIWEHSISEGHDWHWIMDDNIRSFRRLHKNEKVKTSNGSIFRAMEDFILRYKNVAMGGPNYYMFAPARQKAAPFQINTRIYSCNLIRNDLDFRWRGRYNEDTILSLDLLKKGYCTILFNAFLQEKITTQTVKGGNEELYKHGTLDKSKMLVREHPDVSRLTFKFGRYHHHVDYNGFIKNNKLVRKDKLQGKGVNNYGIKLRHRI